MPPKNRTPQKGSKNSPAKFDNKNSNMNAKPLTAPTALSVATAVSSTPSNASNGKGESENQRIAALQKKVDVLEAEKKALQEQFDSLVSNVDLSDKSTKETDEALAKMKRANAELEKQLRAEAEEQMNQLSAALGAEIRKSAEECNRLLREKTSAEKKHEEEIETLNQKCQELQALHDEVKVNHETVSGELQKTKGKHDEVSAALNAAKETHASEKEELESTLQTKQQALQSMIEERDRLDVQLKEEIRTTNAANEKLRTETEQHNAAVQKLELNLEAITEKHRTETATLMLEKTKAQNVNAGLVAREREAIAKRTTAELAVVEIRTKMLELERKYAELAEQNKKTGDDKPSGATAATGSLAYTQFDPQYMAEIEIAGQKAREEATAAEKKLAASFSKSMLSQFSATKNASAANGSKALTATTSTAERGSPAPESEENDADSNDNKNGL